ncbi:MAG: PH domain-containing protein [Acidimicrobiales bacterium]
MLPEPLQITPERSSLFRPLTERGVLVEAERVYYAQRRHWAVLIQPVYETFVFLMLVVWVVGRISEQSPPEGVTNLIEAILIMSIIHIAWMFVTGRAVRSRLAVDPFTTRARPNATRNALLIIGGVAILGSFLIGPEMMGIIGVVVVIGRLIVILARWSFYERRYITNRRLIESGGLLGSRISSMPLSRVTDISYRQSIPGEILRYSVMRVETAGQDQALGLVTFIDNPNRFYEVLIAFSAPPAGGTD